MAQWATPGGGGIELKREKEQARGGEGGGETFSLCRQNLLTRVRLVFD